MDVEGKFRLMAAGAYNNGFAIVFDIDTQQVAFVQGGRMAANYIRLDPKGFEADHTNQTTWIVWDAINTLYPSEAFIKTLPNMPYLMTDTSVQLHSGAVQPFYYGWRRLIKRSAFHRQETNSYGQPRLFQHRRRPKQYSLWRILQKCLQFTLCHRDTCNF